MNILPSLITQEKAVISDCGLYRYWLSREVSSLCDFKPIVFVMLNPSTANAEQDDPTIIRCINYTLSWGGSHLIVVNLFAYRSTDPSVLRDKMTVDPVGPLNDQAISIAANYAYANNGLIVAAWGENCSYMKRNEIVLKNIAQYNPMCLKINKSGHPAHPLYQRKEATLTPLNL